MTTDGGDVDEVRDVLRELVEGADALDDDTLTAIARGEAVTYDVDDAGAALDLTQVVHLLQTYAPIVASMVTIAKTLHDARKGRPQTPTAEEIADAFAARFGGDDLARIAAVVARRMR